MGGKSRELGKKDATWKVAKIVYSLALPKDCDK